MINRLRLLPVLVSSLFLFFLITIYEIASQAQAEDTARTLVSTANGLQWTQLYPNWFFQVLMALVTMMAVGLAILVARYFGKSFWPSRNQLASRRTYLASILLLNILFLGTSHVLSYPPFPFYQTYNIIIAQLCSLFWMGLQEFYDFFSLLLALLLILSTSSRYQNLGAKKAFLNVAQVFSLALLPLGLEIFAFDHSEWNLHVTQFQADYGIFPWFTNADLFFVSTVMFVAVTLLKWSPFLRITRERRHFKAR
ncbi:MAG: hypothetical protein JRN68_08545 [Nitrososphaerota archaeon]|nr:hypothetical protein [Nitrososphaerota archaeon]MDG6990747.1 hypothetical protein [Nitrososphaerota archaeon]